MKVEQVKVGKFFVSEQQGLIREIVRETDDGNVYWRSYNLRDGRPTGDSLLCSKHRITQWANREATAEEVAQLQQDQARARERDREEELVNKILPLISDEQLLAEVRRRGFIVVQP